MALVGLDKIRQHLPLFLVVERPIRFSPQAMQQIVNGGHCVLPYQRGRSRTYILPGIFPALYPRIAPTGTLLCLYYSL